MISQDAEHCRAQQPPSAPSKPLPLPKEDRSSGFSHHRFCLILHITYMEPYLYQVSSFVLHFLLNILSVMYNCSSFTHCYIIFWCVCNYVYICEIYIYITIYVSILLSIDTSCI